jgi:hypothetical protein
MNDPSPPDGKRAGPLPRKPATENIDTASLLVPDAVVNAALPKEANLTANFFSIISATLSPIRPIASSTVSYKKYQCLHYGWFALIVENYDEPTNKW